MANLECSICFESYTASDGPKSPRLLGCAHTFCTECLQDLEKSKTQKLQCPTCRATSEHGAKQLKINFALVELLQLLEEKKVEEKKVEEKKVEEKKVEEKKAEMDIKHENVTCNECETKQSVWHCPTCGCSYCDECSISVHTTSKIMKTHKLAKIRIIPLCKLHKEQVKWYCINDGLLLCPLCVGHEKHTIEDIKTAAEKIRASIPSLLQDSKNAQRTLTDAQTTMNSNLQQLKGNIDQKKHEIENFFSKILDCKKQLILDVDKYQLEKEKNFQLQIQDIIKTSESIKSEMPLLQKVAEEDDEYKVIMNVINLQGIKKLFAEKEERVEMAAQTSPVIPLEIPDQVPALVSLTPISSPVFLDAYETNGFSLSIQWAIPNDDSKQKREFCVQLFCEGQKEGGFLAKWATVTPPNYSQSKLAIDNLSGQSEYKLRVRARNVKQDGNKSQWSSWSPTKTFSTGMGRQSLWAVGGWDGTAALSTIEQLTLEVDLKTKLKRGVWKVLPSKTAYQRSAAACCLVDGKVVIVGGVDGRTRLSTCEMFDVKKSTKWDAVAQLSAVRSALAACSYQGQVYAFGGHDGTMVFRTCEVSSTDLKKWAPLPPMPIARRNATACVLSGQIYILGGCSSYPTDDQVLTQVDRFNIETKTWTQVAPMQCRRQGACACVFEGRIYVFGGSDGAKFLSSCEVYDFESDSWKFLPEMEGPRQSAAAGVLGDQIFVVGGFDGASALPTCTSFDPKTWTWTSAKNCPSLNSPRELLSACNIFL